MCVTIPSKLLACSSIAFIPLLLLLSVLLQGLANVLENQRHPEKEGISCAYWSCWKWLKGDLCRERRDCYHCIWFITPCGGGPVAAVRKSRIPGAPSTHRIIARMETESHPANTQAHAYNPAPFFFLVWRALLHCVNISSLKHNYFVLRAPKSFSYHNVVYL